MKVTDIRWGSTDDPSTWGFTGTKTRRNSNLHNVTIAVSRDPVLRDLVWYDEFLDRLLTTGQREWRDEDDVRIAVHVQDTYRLDRVSPAQVREVLAQRAKETPRHCVRDWLQSLKWDGTARIEHAFEDYWDATPSIDQPADYLRAASANFLISLVARVMRPGCKVDTMPVFEGPQGIFKSSALEQLGAPWHAVSHESVTNKDFFQTLTGSWIVEFSELDTIGRAEVTRVKSVLSTRIDRYRPSYARSVVDHPRQCVFAGTTNTNTWGRDETGLRRFWPVVCGTIDLSGLIAARAQLFAEALHRFQAGATWWEMPTRSTTAVQEDRQAESVLAEAVLPWLLGRTEVTSYEVLTQALKFDAARITVGAEREVGRILKLAGWVHKNRRRSGHQTKLWVAPDAAPSVAPSGTGELLI